MKKKTLKRIHKIFTLPNVRSVSIEKSTIDNCWTPLWTATAELNDGEGIIISGMSPIITLDFLYKRVSGEIGK